MCSEPTMKRSPASECSMGCGGLARFGPGSERFESFVATVMATWRDDGGEPDIGLDLPRWLGEQGLEVHRTKPIVDVVRPGNFVWQWPATFVKVGLARLVDLGRMS